MLVIFLGAVTLGAGGYIAYAGGKIRHREFRTEPAPPKRTHRRIRFGCGSRKARRRSSLARFRWQAEAHRRFNHSTLDQRTNSTRRAKGRTTSAALKKPLGLFDLVLTQILFIVGSSWVGTAAKLGQAHLFFWLLAILLFYIPQAAVVIYLSNRMPLEGGIYQWAKLAFNEFAGFMVAWNLWLLSIMVIALGGMFVTTNISYAIGEVPPGCRTTNGAFRW